MKIYCDDTSKRVNVEIHSVVVEELTLSDAMQVRADLDAAIADLNRRLVRNEAAMRKDVRHG